MTRRQSKGDEIRSGDTRQDGPGWEEWEIHHMRGRDRSGGAERQNKLTQNKQSQTLGHKDSTRGSGAHAQAGSDHALAE